MKKFFIFIIVVAVLVGGYLVVRNISTDNDDVNIQNVNETGTSKPNPSSATFTLDGESVTLVNGKNATSVSPGNAVMEETILLDKFAYGDLNTDGKEDTALLLARYGAGSGTFIYMAAYLSGPVNYHGSEAVFIGDRVTPQSISIKSGVVIVDYLDRKDSQSFADEPTVPTTKQFVYKAGEFQEK